MDRDTVLLNSTHIKFKSPDDEMFFAEINRGQIAFADQPREFLMFASVSGRDIDIDSRWFMDAEHARVLRDWLNRRLDEYDRTTAPPLAEPATACKAAIGEIGEERVGQTMFDRLREMWREAGDRAAEEYQPIDWTKLRWRLFWFGFAAVSLPIFLYEGVCEWVSVVWRTTKNVWRLDPLFEKKEG